MQYLAKNQALANAQDSIILGVFENGELTPSAELFDHLTEKSLSQLIKDGEMQGKVGDIMVLRHVPNSPAVRVFVVGCGKKDALSVKDYRKIYALLIKEIEKTACKSVVSYLNEVALKDRHLVWQLRFAVESMQNARYVFDDFKSKKTANDANIAEFIFNVKEEQLAQAQEILAQACAIEYGVKMTKDLANCPPNICNPAFLALQAEGLASRSHKIETVVINEAQMQELGMTSYLAVSQGSVNEAKMSIMTYRNAPNPEAKPIVLVGKGLTFDAGGISLKPGAGMDEMKYDMCGAATVYGVMNALAELDLPLNIIGVMAGCENLPDGKAYRPGDILTTMSGLTVEVLNTDAEGRLVLCDALTYVKRFEPELVIDMATLTGACVVALGAHNSGLMTEDETLAQQLLSAGDETQDKAWRLPLGEEYNEQLKSNFADLANIGGRWGGASTAGTFLANFTEDYRWAHIDIAGTAWKEGSEKGATGRPVHLIMQFLLNLAKA